MSEYGTTTRARTARKQHRCDGDYRGEGHIIAPGHRYLRHVAFPNSDVNGSDRPWVLRECIACAEDRDAHAGALVGGACATFCHGDTPCALPSRHDGDHSCRRCASRDDAVRAGGSTGTKAVA
jgi:hypothetical protein